MSGFYDPSKDPAISRQAQENWKNNQAKAESTVDKIATKRAQNDLLNQPVIPALEALALAAAHQTVHDLPINSMRLLIILLKNTTASGVVNKNRSQLAKLLGMTELSVTRNCNALRKAHLLVETGEKRLTREYPYEMTKQAMHMPKEALK